MAKENEFTKTFEEWYEWWFNKPFPIDKEKAEELKADFKVLMNKGNLYFKDYEGKVSSITYCSIDKFGDIIFE